MVAFETYPAHRRKPHDGTSVSDRLESCPNLAGHTACPSGYLHWHDWAAKMAETHVQRKCPGCGLYAIWVPMAVA